MDRPSETRRPLGGGHSEAVRVALREAAERRRRKSALRIEAEEAGSDPDDLAEARRVRAEMDELAVDWPDGQLEVVRGCVRHAVRAAAARDLDAALELVFGL